MDFRARLALLCICAAFTTLAHGAITPSQRYALAAPAARFTVEAEGVDRLRALAEDLGKPKSAPLRYALTREIHNVAFSRNASHGGEWRDLPDGMALWRLPVHAAGALTLDFGFRSLFLPPGAQLFIGNATQQLGPYSDADNPRSGQFWTPLLYGDHALIEVLLPQTMKPFLKLDLGTVHVGYRDIFARHAQPKSFLNPSAGSGSCNVDTICPQGDLWRSEINAEAILVMNGGFCSGQLLNDTRGDHAPLLSTANHCITDQSDASSLVVYWKYASPVCRVIGSGANALPVPTADAIPQTGGATLLATYQPADFTLVRLDSPIPVAAQVYWNGWDRSEIPFNGAVVMHHPEADAKRISFAAGTVVVDNFDYGQNVVPGINHWRVDHYSLGTTEAGSSGSGLIDLNHHLRGVLSGGNAECSDPAGDDFYGRLSVAWSGGGASSSLQPWLDPLGTNAQTLEGTGSCAAPTVALSISENPATSGDRIALSASASGGAPPYTYAFDVDGDGLPDNLDPNAASLIAVYPGAFSGNVGATVTDSTGCSGSDTHALVVQAPDVIQSATFFSPPPMQLCGNGNGAIDPGERWQVSVPVLNSSTAPTSGGYAVFAQDLSQSGATAMTLETPVVALPDLAPGQSTAVNVSFAIAANAVCNSALKIDYLGTADNNGFVSAPGNVINTIVGANGTCVPAQCVAQAAPILPLPGNYYDPLRPGNGMTATVTPVPGADPVFFGAWFSGDAGRYPTWYVVNDSLHASQANSTLWQTHQSTQNSWPVPGQAVGSAQVSLIAPDKFVYTWTLNGVAGGAIYVPVVTDPASSLRAWYNPNESGWGTFDEFFPGSGSNGLPFLFQLAYVYDAAGNPRWTVASNVSYRDGDTLTANVVRPACPGCVWLDYTIGAQAVGTVEYFINGTSDTISTDLVLPSAYPGSWIRNELLLTPLP